MTFVPSPETLLDKARVTDAPMVFNGKFIVPGFKSDPVAVST